ncbi:hypothetical protein ZWY2020_014008 [Hordeum vulgare]|nr:hypothetical protein ZWY2020_014008 [Hordeum vulgare]
MAAVWMALAVMLVAAAQVAVAAPVTAPAFLWAPKNYGLSPNEAKEVVHYQTISPKSLADSVLEEGGWSNLVCSKDGPQKNVDVAVIFLGSKLQSSDISKDKQVDPALADILKLSFSSSEVFHGIPLCCHTRSAASSESMKKHLNMDSIQDLLKSRMGNNPSGPTELIVFCTGGFKDNAKSEGQLLLDLVSVLDKSGAKYTVLYASQPYGLLENPSTCH